MSGLRRPRTILTPPTPLSDTETNLGSHGDSSSHSVPVPPPTQTTFKPHQAVKDLANIIRCHYSGPWSSFNNASDAQKLFWWTKFEGLYWWHPGQEEAIRRRFRVVGSKRIRALLCEAHAKVDRGGRPPKWINKDDWKKLREDRDTPHAKKKREINKANRAKSDAHYAGGSIPISLHKRKLEEKLGMPPNALELFKHTHTRKDGTPIDARSVAAIESYTETQTRYQTQAQESDNSLLMPDSYQIWYETFGVKKGRVYGLGSEASIMRRGTEAPISISPTEREELERLRKDVTELKTDKTDIKAELQALQQRLDAFISTVHARHAVEDNESAPSVADGDDFTRSESDPVPCRSPTTVDGQENILFSRDQLLEVIQEVSQRRTSQRR